MSDVYGYVAEDLTPVFVFSDGISYTADKFFRENTQERECLSPVRPAPPAKHSPKNYLNSSETKTRTVKRFVYDAEGRHVKDEDGRPVFTQDEIMQTHTLRLEVSAKRLGLGSFRKQYVDPETGEPLYGEYSKFAIDWTEGACNDDIIP
jgi:hypothetical protein